MFLLLKNFIKLILLMYFNYINGFNQIALKCEKLTEEIL